MNIPHWIKNPVQTPSNASYVPYMPKVLTIWYKAWGPSDHELDCNNFDNPYDYATINLTACNDQWNQGERDGESMFYL